jgi:DNA-binding XRE family transcriptional regulator
MAKTSENKVLSSEPEPDPRSSTAENLPPISELPALQPLDEKLNNPPRGFLVIYSKQELIYAHQLFKQLDLQDSATVIKALNGVSLRCACYGLGVVHYADMGGSKAELKTLNVFMNILKTALEEGRQYLPDFEAEKELVIELCLKVNDVLDPDKYGSIVVASFSRGDLELDNFAQKQLKKPWLSLLNGDEPEPIETKKPINKGLERQGDLSKDDENTLAEQFDALQTIQKLTASLEDVARFTEQLQAIPQQAQSTLSEHFSTVVTTEDLGVLLKAARLQSGKKQKEVADYMGSDSSAIGKIERGSTSPTWKTIQKFAEANSMSIHMQLVPNND